MQLFQLIVNCLGKVRAWGRPGPKGLVREREESPSDCGGKDTNFVQIGQMSVRYRCPDCIGSRLSAPPVLFPPGRLPADEGVFARRSVAVVADDARGLDDPVAGNEKHDGIVSERRADRTLRPFVSRLLRQVGVGGQSAARNLEQRVPYLELKCGSLQMQADRLGVAPVPAEDREGPLLVRIGSPVVRGVRKEASQPFEGFVPAFVGEGQVADALGGRGDDDFTERCRSERVADFEAGSAAFVFAGRHALDRDEKVVQAARGREARFARRIEQRGAGLRQDFFRVFDTQEAGELFGGDAHPSLEHALEVAGAQVHVVRHVAESGVRGAVQNQKFDGRRDPFAVEFLLGFHGAYRCVFRSDSFHESVPERQERFRFQFEKPSFRCQSAAVARQRTVAADDAVAGDEDRERVRAVRIGHGPHGFRLADAAGQLPV